jgi:hypothetical protein
VLTVPLLEGNYLSEEEDMEEEEEEKKKINLSIPKEAN